MFNPTQIVIEAFISELKLTYERTYGLLEPSYPGVIGFVARLSLSLSLSREHCQQRCGLP